MANDAGGSEGDSEASQPPEHSVAPMEALLVQQTALLSTMMQQMKDLNTRVEAAEEGAAKAASQGGGSAQSGEAELEALRQLPYVPHASGNPSPVRPATLETDMAQMYDLYNDKTYDALSKRTNSSMRYEDLVLAPALSYLHDALVHSDATLDAISADGAKLAFIGEKVYAGTDGLVIDSVLKWLKEFDAHKAKAVLTMHAKANAKASIFGDRPRGAGKGGDASKGCGGLGNGEGDVGGTLWGTRRWETTGLKAKAFQQFRVAEGWPWLPAAEATVRFHIVHLMSKGTVQAASLQPYLSAINDYHEERGYPGPAKGRSVSRAVKGMSSLQVQVVEERVEERTVQTWLPARQVSAVHAHGLRMHPVGRAETELLRACTYEQAESSGERSTYWRLVWERD
eukprot:gene34252-biopygen22480